MVIYKHAHCPDVSMPFIYINTHTHTHACTHKINAELPISEAKQYYSTADRLWRLKVVWVSFI